MIIVRGELWIHGNPENRHNLGFITITNNGTGGVTRRNYKVQQFTRGKNPRLLKTVTIQNWPAKQKTAFDLISEAILLLKTQKGKRNGKT